MRKIRKISSNPFILLFINFIFLFASCSKGDVIESSSDNLTGEELFRSIIFADGKVTNRILPLQRINPIQYFNNNNELEKYRKLQDEAINYVMDVEPDFFEEFKTQVLSKDPIIISNAIKKASNFIVTFTNNKLKVHDLSVDKLYESLNKSEIREYDSLENSISYAQNDACVYQVVVVVVLAAVALAVAVAVTVTLWLDTVQEPSEYGKFNSNSLFLDEVSISISENL